MFQCSQSNSTCIIDLTDVIYIPGIDSEKKIFMSQNNFEKRFGQSSVFVSSMLLKNGGVPPNASATSLLKEAIHVISCGYEDKTEWGKEVSHVLLNAVMVSLSHFFKTLLVNVICY